jgi:hypothetical protein
MKTIITQLRYFILILNQPVLVLTNYCCVLNGEAANTNLCLIVFGCAQSVIFLSQDERSITVTPPYGFVEKGTI